MFLSSSINELCPKEENNKAGVTLTFGGQCILAIKALREMLCIYTHNVRHKFICVLSETKKMLRYEMEKI